MKKKRKIIYNEIKENIKNIKRSITEEEWLSTLLYMDEDTGVNILKNKNIPVLLRRNINWILTAPANENLLMMQEALRMLARITYINNNRENTRRQNKEQSLIRKEKKARTEYIIAQIDKLKENAGQNVDPIINGFF